MWTIYVHLHQHPWLSGCITTLTVRNANFCAAMDTLIDQDAASAAFGRAHMDE